MPVAIKDRFSNLPISRQRKYQLRKNAQGRCHQCGQVAVPDSVLCPYCMVQYRERFRKMRGYQRRNKNAKSYRLLLTGSRKKI